MGLRRATSRLDKATSSFPTLTFDVDVDITRSIIHVPVGPRRVVALLCRFGHGPFGCIDLGPSIIYRSAK